MRAQGKNSTCYTQVMLNINPFSKGIYWDKYCFECLLQKKRWDVLNFIQQFTISFSIFNTAAKSAAVAIGDAYGFVSNMKVHFTWCSSLNYYFNVKFIRAHGTKPQKYVPRVDLSWVEWQIQRLCLYVRFSEPIFIRTIYKLKPDRFWIPRCVGRWHECRRRWRLLLLAQLQRLNSIESQQKYKLSPF